MEGDLDMSRIVHLALKVEDLDKTTETSAESQASGQGPCSSPGEIPVKFRAPGGTVAELVPVGRYKKSAT